jgi:hypothetical protein
MKKKLNEIKIGNDGYGTTNVTVTETTYGIEIKKTDPHDWGRVSERVGIPLEKDSLNELINFLTKLKK